MQLRFAPDPADNDETRLEKDAILLVAGSCCFFGTIWWLMYLAIFGWGLTAALPLLFVVIVGAALVVSHLTRNHLWAVYAQLLCILYITTFIQWSIGGLFDSGFVMVWAFLAPIGALIFFSPKHAAVWLGLYLVNVGITLAADDLLSARALDMSDTVRLLFGGMNLGFSLFVVFLFAGYFVTVATRERRRADELLLNTLPRSIADELKRGAGTIAEHVESASVLFADIVGSTPMFKDLDPSVAVEMLNDIFTTFDELVALHGAEKVRTIGDNYMVAAGVPEPREDHAQVLCALALDMVAVLATLPERDGNRLSFRLGINSGPLVAGVIGKSKYQYDLWGDTVNTAARMESTGRPGCVQLSRATYDLVGDRFECEPRGTIDVKGKGPMETWFLCTPTPDVSGPSDADA